MGRSSTPRTVTHWRSYSPTDKCSQRTFASLNTVASGSRARSWVTSGATGSAAVSPPSGTPSTQRRHAVASTSGRRRVLEVDPEELAAVPHQVAAVEVAVREHARPGRDLGAEPVEALRQRDPVLHREVRLAMALQEVLPEEVQLPRQLLEVEGDLEADGALGPARRLALQPHQLVERLPVQLRARVVVRLLEPLLQGEVAEVFEQQDAPRAVDGQDLGDRDAPAGHELPHRHERVLLGLDGLGVHGDHRGPLVLQQPVVAARGRVPGQRRQPHALRGRAEAVLEEAAHALVGVRLRDHARRQRRLLGEGAERGLALRAAAARACSSRARVPAALRLLLGCH
jgi:hypothetical protein